MPDGSLFRTLSTIRCPLALKKPRRMAEWERKTWEDGGVIRTLLEHLEK